ncbi:YggS family pyridoxal phosphate-dependent enzyme [Alkalicoccus luteus]|uniref:Pyridoxal phosphate homeostasis protein n=1 Tax=Alkalicoccus luteus TaxID=1237094 RepID=A0A969PR59_9BACI|nr:YggS family pyridoxal phosphate-dependent enzyme [Alkalicoccus luteus]
MSVSEQLEAVKEQIRAACFKSGRSEKEVTIIAVTKYVSIERAREAVEAGIEDFGENRLEGALEKYEALGNQVNWHFIGSLQSRKVKELLHAYRIIHSLDRKSLAKEIQKRSEEGQTTDCFIQLNVSGEESKAGIAADELAGFLDMLKAYPAVRVIGLMTMAPYTDDPEEVRPYFRKLRELRDETAAKHLPHAPCTELSMGMSNDYHIAVEEGATYIRLGSSLVGSE